MRIAYAETNSGFDKLVCLLAKLAAKTPFGRSMSPKPAGSKGLSAETILRSYFRRLFGVQFARANARLKLERIHLVGSTPEEARQLANQHKTRRHWNPNTDCPSWFSANNCRGTYQAFYEFRQEHRYWDATAPTGMAF